MFCRKCGKAIPEDSKFCSYCGETVNIETEPANSAEELPADDCSRCLNCGELLPPGESTGICDICLEQIGYNPYEYGKCEECGGFLEPDDCHICKKCNAKNEKPANVYTQRPSKSNAPYLNQQKMRHGCLISVLVCVGFVILMGIIGSVSQSTPTTENELETSAVSSAAPLSVRQRSILSAYDTIIKGDVEGMIKDQLKHPDTAVITHDASQLTVNNAIFTDRGSVSYTNAKGKSVKEDFTVSIIATDKVYYPLYVQLGKTVIVDTVKGVNSLGIATAYGKQIFGVQDGNSIFTDNDGTLVLITDEESQKMSLSEYNKIKTGMTYAQVTEIVGSYGEEQARSNVADYESVIIAWIGNGAIGSNANITFQNGKVMAKAQIGLQ